MIYKLVLGSTDFKQQPRNGFDGRSDLKADGEHPNPAPLRVSRQIYKETQNMLYETSTFTGNDLRHFMPLLKQLKVRVITSLYVVSRLWVSFPKTRLVSYFSSSTRPGSKMRRTEYISHRRFTS
jgi:hypothetical protein